jgi:hypothetical protein
MSEPTTPLGAVVRGAVAGAAGTLAMDLVWYERYRRDGGTDRFIDWELSRNTRGWDDAGPPAQLGKRVIEGLFQTELPDEVAALTNNVVHWATGLQWGALYGLVAGSTSHPRIRHGVLLGSVAWATSYVVLPLAKLYKPVWEYDIKTLAKDFSAHLVFGTGTAIAYGALTGRPSRARGRSPRIGSLLGTSFALP